MIDTPGIALGSAPLGNLYRPLPDAQVDELIGFALERGVAFFDTAPLYGAGESERRLGVALSGVRRDSFIISTKVGRMAADGQDVAFDFSRDGVLRSLEGSLNRLKLDRVDIVHIHDADFHFSWALREAFPALAELRSQGVIKAIGAGMNQWETEMDFAENADFDCFLLAGRYTLLQQTPLPFFKFCQQRGIKVFLGGVYNSGILATGAVSGAKYMYADAPPSIMARAQKIDDICARHGVKMSAAAIQFSRAHPAVSALIVGAESKAEFAQTLDHLQARIPGEVWRDLRAAGLIDPAAPVPQT